MIALRWLAVALTMKLSRQVASELLVHQVLPILHLCVPHAMMGGHVASLGDGQHCVILVSCWLCVMFER